jgi:hypothetical protein
MFFRVAKDVGNRVFSSQNAVAATIPELEIDVATVRFCGG